MSQDKSDYFYERPLWQKILIYLIIGGVIYALIYYLFVVRKDTYVYNYVRKLQGAAVPTAIPQPKHIVRIENFSYSPATITIKVGDTVTWVNADALSQNAVADDKSFATGIIDIGQSQSITFAKPGTYKYHCSLHSGMRGTVIVK